MAIDMFLKIDGIKGDSTDDKHKDWTEVVSYTHGIAQALGGAASAQGAHAGGRADHQDFAFVMRLCSASPTLALHCCNGKHIPEITFELCRALGEKTIFMSYVFKDCIIASVNPAGSSESEDPVPMEEVAVRYGSIQWAYTPTDPTGGGKTGAAVQAGWSTLMNKAL